MIEYHALEIAQFSWNINVHNCFCLSFTLALKILKAFKEYENFPHNAMNIWHQSRWVDYFTWLFFLNYLLFYLNRFASINLTDFLRVKHQLAAVEFDWPFHGKKFTWTYIMKIVLPQRILQDIWYNLFINKYAKLQFWIKELFSFNLSSMFERNYCTVNRIFLTKGLTNPFHENGLGIIHLVSTQKFRKIINLILHTY